ncbi:F0F1 ATP synthase subunit A [Anaeromyxobacter oryzisoli]|uniref:F0F1 ATP synthase subunit A n=1 Tax=Anaeromyxobacter oryzisoli TaxID=2925408 RepID=UPI001F567A35|nr:F0F1 ATP synthase subunit A [Anaeromyxobacter sp. SG63]
MTAATLVTLALSLTLAQHEGNAAAPAAAPVVEQAAPSAGAPQPGAPAVPAEHGAAAAEEHGEGHAAAGEHGAAGGHAPDIGSVMLHHVSDNYVLEYPGHCEGSWQWNCEADMREIFGSSLKFGRLDMTPTKHVVMMWIASVLLLLVVLGSVRKKSVVPHGLYNFIEVLVAFVRNEIAVKNIGEKDADRFTPYLVTAFFFILFLNLFGLVPFAATATANISVTMMLATFTWIITQYAQIKAVGIRGYLSHLTGGVPGSLWPLWFIMVPVEFLGLFTKPFALTVRLFANMVAGHFVILALLGLIFVISPWVMFGAVPMALSIFMLELFVAFVQAYIFTMLSSLFIGSVVVSHDHGEHEEHGAQGSHVAG